MRTHSSMRASTFSSAVAVTGGEEAGVGGEVGSAHDTGQVLPAFLGHGREGDIAISGLVDAVNVDHGSAFLWEFILAAYEQVFEGPFVLPD